MQPVDTLRASEWLLFDEAGHGTGTLRVRSALVAVGVHLLALALVAHVGVESAPPVPRSARPALDLVLVRTPPSDRSSPGGGGGGRAGPRRLAPLASATGAGAPSRPRSLGTAAMPAAIEPTPVSAARAPTLAPIASPSRTPFERPLAPVSAPVQEVRTLQPIDVPSSPTQAPSVARSEPRPHAAGALAESARPRDVGGPTPVPVSDAVAYRGIDRPDGIVAGADSNGEPRVAEIPRGEGGSSGLAWIARGGAGTGGSDGPGAGTGVGPGTGPGEGTGDGVGRARSCQLDPVCRNYLEDIRARVSRQWRPEGGVGSGKVRLRFRIDRSGAAHDVTLAAGEGDALGRSCMAAFLRASPFPPPPGTIAYLLEQNIVAIFGLERPKVD